MRKLKPFKMLAVALVAGVHSTAFADGLMGGGVVSQMNHVLKVSRIESSIQSATGILYLSADRSGTVLVDPLGRSVDIGRAPDLSIVVADAAATNCLASALALQTLQELSPAPKSLRIALESFRIEMSSPRSAVLRVEGVKNCGLVSQEG